MGSRSRRAYLGMRPRESWSRWGRRRRGGNRGSSGGPPSCTLRRMLLLRTARLRTLPHVPPDRDHRRLHARRWRLRGIRAGGGLDRGARDAPDSRPRFVRGGQHGPTPQYLPEKDPDRTRRLPPRRNRAARRAAHRAPLPAPRGARGAPGAGLRFLLVRIGALGPAHWARPSSWTRRKTSGRLPATYVAVGWTLESSP